VDFAQREIQCARSAGGEEGVNRRLLATAVKSVAEQAGRGQADLTDTEELLNALWQILVGEDIEKAFGDPEDWGLGSPIGRALMQRETGQLAPAEERSEQ
jgi:hypothetical protein